MYTRKKIELNSISRLFTNNVPYRSTGKISKSIYVLKVGVPFVANKSITASKSNANWVLNHQ